MRYCWSALHVRAAHPLAQRARAEPRGSASTGRTRDRQVAAAAKSHSGPHAGVEAGRRHANGEPLSFRAYGVSCRARAKRAALQSGIARFAPKTWFPRSRTAVRPGTRLDLFPYSTRQHSDRCGGRCLALVVLAGCGGEDAPRPTKRPRWWPRSATRSLPARRSGTPSRASRAHDPRRRRAEPVRVLGGAPHSRRALPQLRRARGADRPDRPAARRLRRGRRLPGRPGRHQRHRPAAPGREPRRATCAPWCGAARSWGSR